MIATDRRVLVDKSWISVNGHGRKTDKLYVQMTSSESAWGGRALLPTMFLAILVHPVLNLGFPLEAVVPREEIVALQAVELFIWTCLVVGGLIAPLGMSGIFLDHVHFQPSKAVEILVEVVCFSIALAAVPWKKDRLVYSDNPVCTCLEHVFGENTTTEAIIRANCYKQFLFAQWKGPLWAHKLSSGLYYLLKLPKGCVGRLIIVCTGAWALGRDSSQVNIVSILVLAALMDRLLQVCKRVNASGKGVAQRLLLVPRRLLHEWKALTAMDQPKSVEPELNNHTGYATVFAVEALLWLWWVLVMIIIATYSNDFEEELLTLLGLLFLPGIRHPRHLKFLVLITVVMGMTLVLPMGVGAFASILITKKRKPAIRYKITPSRTTAGIHPESCRTPGKRERARVQYRAWTRLNKKDKLARTVKKARYKHASSIARRILAGKPGNYVNARARKLGTFLILVIYMVTGGLPRSTQEPHRNRDTYDREAGDPQGSQGSRCGTQGHSGGPEEPGLTAQWACPRTGPLEWEAPPGVMIGGGGGKRHHGATTASVDHWELTSEEIAQTLADSRCSYNVVVPHSMNRGVDIATRLIQNSVDNMSAMDYIVFCDNSHFRVVFRLENNWHLFDSLGRDGVFVKDIWPTIQGMDPNYELHMLGFSPQSDGVNCGVWVLWAVAVWKEYITHHSRTPLRAYFWEQASRDQLTSLGPTAPSSAVELNEQFIHARKRILRVSIPRDSDPRTREVAFPPMGRNDPGYNKELAITVDHDGEPHTEADPTPASTGLVSRMQGIIDMVDDDFLGDAPVTSTALPQTGLEVLGPPAPRCRPTNRWDSPGYRGEDCNGRHIGWVDMYDTTASEGEHANRRQGGVASSDSSDTDDDPTWGGARDTVRGKGSRPKGRGKGRGGTARRRSLPGNLRLHKRDPMDRSQWREHFRRAKESNAKNAENAAGNTLQAGVCTGSPGRRAIGLGKKMHVKRKRGGQSARKGQTAPPVRVATGIRPFAYNRLETDALMFREGVVKVEPHGSAGARGVHPAASTPVRGAHVWHKLVTWNVAGLKLITNDLSAIIRCEKPSAIVLTEVKIAASTLKKLGNCLGYTGYATTPPAGEGKGGVILLVSKALGTPEYARTPPALRGYVQELLFKQVHQQGFRLIGVYVPPGDGEKALRAKIMRYVQMAARRSAEAGELVAVGGDFNPGTSRFPGCAGEGPCQKVPVAPEGLTWAQGPGAGKITDYWFTSKVPGAYWDAFSKPRTICGWEGTISDHVPLFTSVLLRKVAVVAPPVGDSPKGKTKVAFPLKVHNSPQSLLLFEASLDQLTPGIEELRLDLALRGAGTVEEPTPGTTMDELGAKVSVLLGQALEVAERMLTTKEPRSRTPLYMGKVWLHRADAKLRKRGRRFTSAAMKLQQALSKPYHLGDGWRRLTHPTQYMANEMPWALKLGWIPPPTCGPNT